jgi:hypothetical protein
MLGIERERKRKRDQAPIVSYDSNPRPHPRPHPRQASEKNVYFEPARTHRDDRRLSERTVRGILYESDTIRPRRRYRIEERTPDRSQVTQDRERKERERRERRRREREWREGIL